MDKRLLGYCIKCNKHFEIGETFNLDKIKCPYCNNDKILFELEFINKDYLKNYT